MSVEYDPAKAAGNFKKHGVSFANAEGVFYDPLALHRPDPDADADERFVAMGLGATGDILMVIYTLRGQDVRLISPRRATRQEVKEYEG
jgi:uncharacterized protein